ncbi:MAG TPA: TetR/AcrR family transcriptional regulator [Candidatus Bathyarchaeia archaeon]
MPKVVPEYKEEARNRILEATFKTLLAKGYTKTTMTDIANEVGVSKAAIYQYYDSKETLMKAATEYIIEMIKKNVWQQKYIDNIRDISSPKFYQDIVDFMATVVPNDFMIEMTIAMSQDKSMKDLIKIYYTVIEFFKGIADDLIKRGAIRPDVDKESLIIGIMALQDGLTLAEKVGVDPTKTRKAWSYNLNLIMDELSKKND